MGVIYATYLDLVADHGHRKARGASLVKVAAICAIVAAALIVILIAIA